MKERERETEQKLDASLESYPGLLWQNSDSSLAAEVAGAIAKASAAHCCWLE